MQNESIELDWTFKCSLIQDIIMVNKFISLCADKYQILVIFPSPVKSLFQLIPNKRFHHCFYHTKGMNYLHGSDIKIHGRLSSSACVVDGRFLLKLRCYGPKCFYEAKSKKKSKKETLNYNSKTSLQGPFSVVLLFF